MNNFEFANGSFTSSAAMHDAIAAQWIGGGNAATFSDAEATLEDLDQQAGIVESEAGWNLSTLDGYERAELKAAVERLRDTLLKEAADKVREASDDATSEIAQSLSEFIAERSEELGEEEPHGTYQVYVNVNRNVEYDEDGEIDTVYWDVKFSADEFLDFYTHWDTVNIEANGNYSPDAFALLIDLEAWWDSDWDNQAAA